MDHKKANLLFLIIILTHIAVIGAMYLVPGFADGITGALSLMLGELIIIVPTLVFIGISSIRGTDSIPELAGFRRIRLSSALLLIVYAMLLMPLTASLNLFTMTFTSNIVMESAETMLSYPWYMLLLCIGIIGPLCEEFVFRGVMYRSMKKSITVGAAVLMSSIMFGIVHMNVNQAVYAFVLGLFMALAVEATDSLWASLIVHMTFNLQQAGAMLIINKVDPGVYSNFSSDSFSMKTLYVGAAFYLVIGVAAAAIAVCLLVCISGYEGRKEHLRAVLATGGRTAGKNNAKDKTVPVTVTFALAVAVGLIYMLFGDRILFALFG